MGNRSKLSLLGSEIGHNIGHFRDGVGVQGVDDSIRGELGDVSVPLDLFVKLDESRLASVELVEVSLWRTQHEP